MEGGWEAVQPRIPQRLRRHWELFWRSVISACKAVGQAASSGDAAGMGGRAHLPLKIWLQLQTTVCDFFSLFFTPVDLFSPRPLTEGQQASDAVVRELQGFKDATCQLLRSKRRFSKDLCHKY
mmetsp:Transcript_63256/g.100427  ORF Transcript_63256/g.100427 Transcript_63256/m.100427 type:complete len:123 (+) Transcript_63256:123-491(+)